MNVSSPLMLMLFPSGLAPIVDPRWNGALPVPHETYDPDHYLTPPRVFADGRTAWCVPTLMGARITLSRHPTDVGYQDYWCFNGEPTVVWRGRAVFALAKWNGEGDPEGWMKHPGSGRYRTEGDPLREYLEGSDVWARGGL